MKEPNGPLAWVKKYKKLNYGKNVFNNMEAVKKKLRELGPKVEGDKFRFCNIQFS